MFQISPGIHALVDQRRRNSYGGNGYVGGSLPNGEDDGRAKILNVPTSVQITVLDPISYTVVARAVSKSDGTWQVRYLDTSRRFTVIGSDWSMQVNSAIQDWVQPSPMEP